MYSFTAKAAKPQRNGKALPQRNPIIRSKSNPKAAKDCAKGGIWTRRQDINPREKCLIQNTDSHETFLIPATAFPRAFLYAALGAVPSRPSGLAVHLIIISFAVKLYIFLRGLAPLAVKLYLFLCGLAALAVTLLFSLASLRPAPGQAWR